MEDETKKLRDQVNRSGYPFEIAVANEVERISSNTKWNILSKEHPWRSHVGEYGGYIDLVIGYGIVRLVIECKRPKEATWIFLVSNENSKKVFRFKAALAHLESRKIEWQEWRLFPASAESDFCIVRGQNDKSTPTLERISGILLDATEALGLEEIHKTMGPLDDARFLFPVIVTAANLKICNVNPDNISLEDGELMDAEFETVPYIRFRKSLATDHSPENRVEELSEISKFKERSILVVKSTHLSEFLKKWDIKRGEMGW